MGVGGIAEYVRHTAGFKHAADIGIQLDDNVGNGKSFQGCSDRAAHTAEAAEDNVVPQAVRSRNCMGMCGQLSGQPPAGQRGRNEAEKRCIHEDGDQRCGQGCVIEVTADNPGVARTSDKNKRELADLCQPQRNRKGGPDGITEHADHHRPYGQLAENDESNNRSGDGDV